ncbi:MAG: hypothetical protein M3O31_14935 [Acidobacteriota bacterium]|nr:hypothetical protein [Acidobacteriota bacterium]
MAGTMLAAAVAGAQGPSARFDLTGPKVDVRVTRSGVTLPIASVPNLQAGDRIWLHPDLPSTQSVHYLMVLAFLRGTTNPPPDRWFIRIETWDRKVRAEGVEVTVPAEAQEAVVFLAPVTGGDFSTLRSAVQGRPGIFVRASQDLAAAGFEQARIEKYIASMRELSPEEAADPKQLQERSNLIAARLALKPNGDCVKLAPDQQYTCLTQSGGQTLMDDGHGQTIVDALTSNSSAGLIGTVSSTQLAGGGVYSAYVGSIVDVVHIMGSLHTAQYQYIPAIAFPQQQALNLRLNTPPSFHNPKSVIVIGLPAVQATVAPPLRAAEPNHVSCLQKPGVVLPVEGAPLVFSTSFAHDLVLHLNVPPGTKPGGPDAQDIPLIADAGRGGLLLTTIPKRHALPQSIGPASTTPAAGAPADSATVNGATAPSKEQAAMEAATGAELTGTIKGFWGFDAFTGPTMPLEDTPGKDWRLAGDEPVIAGKNQHIVLASSGTACIQSIALEPEPGKPESWKPADKPNQVDVTLDVPAHDASALHLDVAQFGEAKAAEVSLISYSPPAKLDGLSFHAGDTTAMLTGTSLDQVRQVEFGGVQMKPAGEGTNPVPLADGKAQLRLALPAKAAAPAVTAGSKLTAHVALNDGRILYVPVSVESARPMVSLLGKADVPESAAKSEFNIRLASEDDLPANDGLIFSLKSAQPFPRAGKVEIASPDDSLHTTLSLADASPALILEGPDTLLATLQPLKAFGPSAFGPIRMRAVTPDGSVGDWLPLVTLVRLPVFTRLSCPVVTAPVVAPRGKTAKGARAAASPGDGVEVPAADAEATLPVASTDAPSQSVAACSLSGVGLYFVDSIATDADFTHPIRVPQGFVGSSIDVPPPTGAVYYLRLRDDPKNVDTVSLPAGPL